MVDVGAVDDQSPKTGMSRGFLLASAAKVVEAGNRISMGRNPGDNYIEDRNTGERIGLRVEWGTYVFDVEHRRGEQGTITLDSGAGVNVFPEELQKSGSNAVSRPKAPRDWCEREHHREDGHKIIRFRGRELGFTRPA